MPSHSGNTSVHIKAARSVMPCIPAGFGNRDLCTPQRKHVLHHAIPHRKIHQGFCAGYQFSNLFMVENEVVHFSGRPSTHQTGKEKFQRILPALKEQLINFFSSDCWAGVGQNTRS